MGRAGCGSDLGMSAFGWVETRTPHLQTLNAAPLKLALQQARDGHIFPLLLDLEAFFAAGCIIEEDRPAGCGCSLTAGR